MDYIRATISTTGQGVEMVAGALSAIGIDQIEIIEDEAAIQGHLDELSARWDYVDPSELTMGAEPCIRVYIPIEDAQEKHTRIVREIRERMEWLKEQDIPVDMGTLRVVTDVIREQDWANNWKQYYKPVRIGRHIVIKPSWEDFSPRPGDKVIELDPGMAFGTGTHETTALCLEAVERYTRPGAAVLDVGCGSGILSIAAALCGAGEVTAIDIDPVAVKVAKENVERNGVGNIVTCREADLLAGEQKSADLVLANIVADVILRLMPAAYAHTNTGGRFIASGIIDEREGELLESAEKAGFAHVETLSRGSWRAIVWGK